mmetsp:Transcript_56441/g.104490  ORF Transcript_56441/g.104490 Transcript_56441/m.104490 type:complete len:194 (-) Transcript_56441:81-662(-)
MPFLAGLQVVPVEGRQSVNLLVLGLDNSGKTTLLKKISDEDVAHVEPTKGFNAKSLVLPGGSQLAVWDMAGSLQSRPYWRHFFASSTAVVFVVDATDRGRLYENQCVLHETLAEEQLRGVPLLILANKHDLSSALNEDELRAELQLEKLRLQGVTCGVRPCCAKSGAGVLDALQWLVDTTHKDQESGQSFIDV